MTYNYVLVKYFSRANHEISFDDLFYNSHLFFKSQGRSIKVYSIAVGIKLTLANLEVLK